MEAIVAGNCTVWLSAFLEQVAEADRWYIVQIEKDLFSITVDPPDPADVINLSCNPNSRRGQPISPWLAYAVYP